MKLTHPELDTVFDTDGEKVPVLIVEDPAFLFRFLSDIRSQLDGEKGDTVISEKNTPLEIAKYAELLTEFIPFDINRKTLLTRITAALEKNALSPSLYERSMKLLSEVENYLYDLSFELPCDIAFSKVSVSAIVRGAGIALREEYPTLGEKIIDYMELVTEFDRSKLFITVNLRSFIGDEEASRFMKTALDHGFPLLMVEAHARSLLEEEQRVIVDGDLCEIGPDLSFEP